VIKDRRENLLKDGDQIRIRWKEYIEELYDKAKAPTVEEMSEKHGNPPVMKMRCALV